MGLGYIMIAVYYTDAVSGRSSMMSYIMIGMSVTLEMMYIDIKVLRTIGIPKYNESQHYVPYRSSISVLILTQFLAGLA